MAHEHIPIYVKGHIPYNTGKSKYEALVPWREDWDVGDALDAMYNPEKRVESTVAANTATRKLYIPRGNVSENFDDEPYIVPFVAKGSRECVIVCPGGAYCDVSLDNEGYPTGEFLREQGITAFVLKYRVWPYLYPAAKTDLIRAIKYLRHNSDKYGFDPDKISILGYSAGGNLVASTVFVPIEEELRDSEYIPDEIDLEDGSVCALAAIYPELLADRFLMSLQLGERVYTDKKYCDTMLAKMSIPQYVDKDSVPCFLCGCIDDTVVDPENILKMGMAYKKAGAPFELHMFAEGGHGFGVTQNDIPEMYGHPAFDMSGTKEWIRLYVAWLRKTLK